METSVHFVSLGCPKNLVDSEIMMAQLLSQGFRVVEDPVEAEVIVVNTCGFVEEARKESVAKILEMASCKGKGRLRQLVVAGCLAQRYKEELVSELPEVDVFIGTGDFQNITQILKEAKAVGGQRSHFEHPTYLDHSGLGRINSQPFFRAYLKISEGCMKRCAFCAIPLIRGRLQSRSVESLVMEANHLAETGVRELVVVSHDFTDYGWDLRKDRRGPRELLESLAQVKGLEWIRVLYLYPDGVDSSLIQTFKEQDHITKYFDLPLQHINNEVLKRMNRKTSRQQLEQVISEIRREIPTAAMRTHFLVGFPGETENQFRELVDFVKEHQFEHMGCFMFSAEEGTPSAKMSDQIDVETKERRFNELMSVQRKISREKNRGLVGQTVEVLVEGPSEETELLLQGRMASQAPDIDGVVLINEGMAERGQMVQVKITEAMEYDVIGKILIDTAH